MQRQNLGASLLGLGLSSTLLLGACGSEQLSGTQGSTPAGSSTSVSAAKIPVVASTNVYGNIASVVGGDAVEVTSIVSDPGQDPHSYEANTRVALKLSQAKLVLENGGGYDDFVDTMLKTAKTKPVVLNAVTVSGLTASGGGELNEHVWYSFPSVQKVADQVAIELGKVDPGKAATFTANAKSFNADVDQLISAGAQLKSRHQGEGVGITEPVPVYLLDAVGLEDKTPEEFSEAVEEGEDVSAAVLKETLDLYSGKQVKVLVYNEQTSGPVTEQVKAAAEKAGVPVVGVTETLPEGQTYLTWMKSNVDQLGQALGE